MCFALFDENFLRWSEIARAKSSLLENIKLFLKYCSCVECLALPSCFALCSCKTLSTNILKWHDLKWLCLFFSTYSFVMNSSTVNFPLDMLYKVWDSFWCVTEGICFLWLMYSSCLCATKDILEQSFKCNVVLNLILR